MPRESWGEWVRRGRHNGKGSGVKKGSEKSALRLLKFVRCGARVSVPRNFNAGMVLARTRASPLAPLDS